LAFACSWIVYDAIGGGAKFVREVRKKDMAGFTAQMTGFTEGKSKGGRRGTERRGNGAKGRAGERT